MIPHQIDAGFFFFGAVAGRPVSMGCGGSGTWSRSWESKSKSGCVAALWTGRSGIAPYHAGRGVRIAGRSEIATRVGHSARWVINRPKVINRHLKNL